VSGAADAVVLVTSRSFREADPKVREALESGVAEVRYAGAGQPLDSADLAAELGDVDGVILGTDRADAAAIEAGVPRLRVLSRYGTATDNVDLEAAARNGVVVTHTPGSNAGAVAELAIGLMLSLARGIPAADRAVRAGGWPTLQGRELRGATVGLLGFGHIGQEVARRAVALGCRVIAHDPVADRDVAERLRVELAGPERVAERADFLSLHLPLTDETRNLVAAPLLDRMQPGAFLVNTARGELVVDEELASALDSGRLAGAALDTLRREPPEEGNPLVGRDDVILTPHTAAHTHEATLAMGRGAVANLLAVLDGRDPPHRVV
jgi:D-3-phosphoglycerate dehydrogenase / 2-oxoglutarate reductase